MAAPSIELSSADATRSYGRTPAALKGCAETARILSERFQLGRKTLWFLKTFHIVFLPSGRKSGPKTKYHARCAGARWRWPRF